MSYRALYWAARYTTEATPGMGRVLSELAAFADADGVAWPSVPTMAADLGMSERNVQRMLRSLEGAGLIAFIGTSDIFADVRADKVTSVWQLAVPDDILHGNMKQAIAARRANGRALRTLGSEPKRGDNTVTPRQRGDKSGMSGVTISAERGDKSGTSGVTALSPKRLNKDSYKDSRKDIPLKPPTGGGASEQGEEGDQMFTMNGGEQVVTMSDGACYSVRPGRCTARQVTEHLDGLADPQACPVCAYSPANRLTHGRHHEDSRTAHASDATPGAFDRIRDSIQGMTQAQAAQTFNGAVMRMFGGETA